VKVLLANDPCHWGIELREAELSAPCNRKRVEGLGDGVVLERRCSVQRKQERETSAYIGACAIFNFGPLHLHRIVKRHQTPNLESVTLTSKRHRMLHNRMPDTRHYKPNIHLRSTHPQRQEIWVFVSACARRISGLARMKIPPEGRLRTRE